MTHHQSAQGLASLGRHGDSMLVHMSPHEVAGLNYLAKKQGTKLTVNPETGLPEAFSLGGLFSSILPMFAGAMFPGAGFEMAPLLAGAATGAGLAAVKGDNPLLGGLMGGLGGVSGSNLAQGLGAAAGVNAPGGAIAGNAVNAVANPEYVSDSMMKTLAGYQAPTALQQSAANTINQSGFANSAISGAGNIIDKGLNQLSTMGTGAGNLMTGQPGAWDAFKGAYGATPLTNTQAALKIGMPVGGAILGGLEPSDLYGEPIKPSDKGKYDPYATLNLSGDTGLRLYAMGGTVTTGGLRDLYSSTDMQSNPALSRDGYGIGRLDSLAREQSLNQAQTMGYAEGGETSLNLDQIPSLNLSTSAGGKNIQGAFKQLAYENPDQAIWKLFATAPSSAWHKQMAQGGPVSFADGGDALKEDLPALDENMGLGSIAPASNPMASTQTMPTQAVQNAAATLSNAPSSDGSIIQQVTTKLQQDPNYQPQNPIEAAIVKQIKGTDEQGQQQGLASLRPVQPSQPMAPSYNASQPIGPTYYAGMNAPRGFADGGDISYKDVLSALAVDNFRSDPNPMGKFINTVLPSPNDYRGNPNALGLFTKDLFTGSRSVGNEMAQGGYLDGQGDGMSDSIPATIEGKQPARLADGEFVIPADVVSHIGNGSSKAGSQRLYSMLDRVRKARTGTKRQGKQIKPEKYMPA